MCVALYVTLLIVTYTSIFIFILALYYSRVFWVYEVRETSRVNNNNWKHIESSQTGVGK